MSQITDKSRLKITKYCLLVFNVILFLVGCVLLGIGIQSKIGKQEYIILTDKVVKLSGYFVASNFCIIIGVIVVLVAFFGCSGVVAKNTIMLLIFFILLAIVFILELAVCIYGYSKKDEIKNQLQLSYKDVINSKYTNETKNDIRDSIDKFQRDFHCCGFNGVKDWSGSKYVSQTNTFPSSCCKPNNCTTDANQFRTENFFSQGCFESLVKWFSNHISLISTCSLIFGIIQIFGMAFSMTLFCMLKNMRAA